MSDSNIAFRLAGMGDIMLDRKVGQRFIECPSDFELTAINGILKNYDLIFANLETTISTRGAPYPKQDPHVVFRSHPDTLDVLKALGINVVSLANNHMLDYGVDALADTIAHLDAAGIKHVGAGCNYKEANQPLLLEFNGQKVAMLAYVFIYSSSTRMAAARYPGVSDHRINRILPQIKKLKKDGYKVIISVHWGMEYSFYPLPYLSKQARSMIDAGASLVLGHGPHYPQGIENYRNSNIVYSMGNFIFDEPYYFAKRSFIYGADMGVSGNILGHQIYPVLLPDHVPFLAEGPDKLRLETMINSLDLIYRKKSERFWKKISTDYFFDIVNRVVRMRSFKFLFVPPKSFYTQLSLWELSNKVTRIFRSTVNNRR